MWCLPLYMLWTFIFAFAVSVNFYMLQNFRLRVTESIVLKNGLLKKIAVGNVTNFFTSLPFGFAVLTVCLDLAINFNALYLFYAILNSVMVIVTYNQIKKHSERVIVKEVSDYYLFKLVPILVTTVTVSLYVFLKYHLVTVNQVLPDVNVVDYLDHLINSHLNGSCPLWGSTVVFHKYVNYLMWIFIINLSQYKPLFLGAVLLQLLKDGLSVWLIGRTLLGFYILKFRG